MDKLGTTRELLREAAHCLEAYRRYGEDMRKIGRGFHPTGLCGHGIDAIIAAIRAESSKED